MILTKSGQCFFKSQIDVDDLESMKKYLIRFLKKKYDLQKSRAFPVGTIRIRKDGKKYKKVSKDKWSLFYEGQSRGQLQAVRNVIKKIEKAESISDLAKIIKENRKRFVDEEGKVDKVVSQFLNFSQDFKRKISKKDNSIGNYYINNEMQKLILEFNKEDYLKLSDETKKELKSKFLWSGKKQAWVSRGKKGSFSFRNAILFAEANNLKKEEEVGKELSFSEQKEKEKAKAEYKENKISEKIKTLEKEINEIDKKLDSPPYNDYSFLTEPIKIGHHSEKKHRNARQKMSNMLTKRYQIYNEILSLKEKTPLQRLIGLESNIFYVNKKVEDIQKEIDRAEKKVEKYKETIALIENTQEKSIGQNEEEQKKAKEYVNKKYEYLKNVVGFSTPNGEKRYLSLIQKAKEKQNYYKRIQEELKGQGFKVFSKESIEKEGYNSVKIRDNWYEIIKLNPKTVTIALKYYDDGKTFHEKYSYSKIKDARKIKVSE